MQSLHSPKSVLGRLALITIALSVFSVGCALATEAGKSADSSVSLQTRPVHSSENHNFDSFPVMVATADVTIIGRVTAELEGVTVGDQFDSIDYFRFETDVEEVLAGDLDLKTIVLQIDELSLDHLYGDTWTQPGARSVMFLSKRRDGGPLYYRPVNSQGVYRIVGTDRLEATRRKDDNLTQLVATWSLPDLHDQVETAKALIGRGEVQPQPGPSRHQP